MSKRGFTLIELLIAITIIAIISSVGFISYSQSQVLARDARRKSDLRSIATALQLYYQNNKLYPCTSGIQTTSGAVGFWIKNEKITTGCSTLEDFDSKYINNLPIDPKDNTGNPRDGLIGYAYSGRGDCSAPYNIPGYFFTLITRLENAKDPEALANKDQLWCDQNPSKYLFKDHNWRGDLFVVTSL